MQISGDVKKADFSPKEVTITVENKIEERILYGIFNNCTCDEKIAEELGDISKEQVSSFKYQIWRYLNDELGMIE